MWSGLLTNGELAPFLTPSLWLRRIYELLLLTFSLWPQGVFMSCSENFCEWNHVKEGGIYSVGDSLWCWHLFACIWWLSCLVTVLNRLSSLAFSLDAWKIMYLLIMVNFIFISLISLLKTCFCLPKLCFLRWYPSLIVNILKILVSGLA
jgi:hypothetical protein